MLPERRHWRCPDVFIVNFGHILQLLLQFLLFTLKMYLFVSQEPYKQVLTFS